MKKKTLKAHELFGKFQVRPTRTHGLTLAPMGLRICRLKYRIFCRYYALGRIMGIGSPETGHLKIHEEHTNRSSRLTNHRLCPIR